MRDLERPFYIAAFVALAALIVLAVAFG